jgi:hypothetical protein
MSTTLDGAIFQGEMFQWIHAPGVEVESQFLTA